MGTNYDKLSEIIAVVCLSRETRVYRPRHRIRSSSIHLLGRQNTPFRHVIFPTLLYITLTYVPPASYFSRHFSVKKLTYILHRSSYLFFGTNVSPALLPKFIKKIRSDM